jgi:D-glycero-D-manno-heptose 1,7-bisphosphate phosphatase
LNTKAALFLDRDGVVLEPVIVEGLPKSIRLAKDVEFVGGLGELLNTANKLGLKVYVITNQPDVDRGYTSEEEVERVHARILGAHPTIEGAYYCPHDDEADCLCRKPKPGLLLQAARDHNLDLHKSFFVGDRWRDVDAGNAAGCFTIFLERGYEEQLNTSPDAKVSSLASAAALLGELFTKREQYV